MIGVEKSGRKKVYKVTNEPEKEECVKRGGGGRAVRDEERGIASEGAEGGGVKKSIGPLHYHTLLAGFGTVSVCHNSR